MQKERGKTHGGLTLIELMVVIALLALVTATVTVSLGNTLGPAALQQSVSEWEFTDQQLRARARHTGKPVAIRLEIGSNRLLCTLDPEGEAPPTIRTLGRGVRITKYISATQETTSGTGTIEYDERGSSETFAIELTGRSDQRRWLLVAGLSGQITEVAHENAARELLQQLRPPSLHAG
jgi:prepilin-type N-terminal cleavage/methylation domain-containing protein